MMTSFRNSPSFRHARSSLVTAIRPLQGAEGYWISLQTKLRVKLYTGSGLGELGEAGFTWREAAAGRTGSSADRTSVRKQT